PHVAPLHYSLPICPPLRPPPPRPGPAAPPAPPPPAAAGGTGGTQPCRSPPKPQARLQPPPPPLEPVQQAETFPLTHRQQVLDPRARPRRCQRLGRVDVALVQPRRGRGQAQPSHPHQPHLAEPRKPRALPQLQGH